SLIQKCPTRLSSKSTATNGSGKAPRLQTRHASAASIPHGRELFADLGGRGGRDRNLVLGRGRLQADALEMAEDRIGNESRKLRVSVAVAAGPFFVVVAQ